LRGEAGEHQVDGEELRKSIVDWVRLGSSIEGVPGSHLISHVFSSTYVPHHSAIEK